MSKLPHFQTQHIRFRATYQFVNDT